MISLFANTAETGKTPPDNALPRTSISGLTSGLPLQSLSSQSHLPQEASNLPVAAYNVSGEYSMVKAAALNGWVDEEKLVMETMMSFKRSGADLILSYHAKDVARWLKGQ